MKKVLITVVVLGLFIAFFFPKKILGPQRICIGFKSPIERKLVPDVGEYVGGQVSSSEICYGILIPKSGAKDNFYGQG